MHLERLDVSHFRCIDRFESSLSPGRILIVGDNARGKTTLLECVFYLVTGRSFRTRYDNDCVPWNAESGTLATVRGILHQSSGGTCRLAVALGPGIKSVRIDDQPIERLAELWGRLQAVLFTPDDLQLVKGGPGERRRYLDVGLSQINRDFLFHLQRYSQVLRQRNALLKQNGISPTAMRNELAAWDMQLIEHGIPVMQARGEFLMALEPRAARFYERISGDHAAGSEALRLQYVNCLRLDTPIDPERAPAAFHRLLDSQAEDDMRRRQTSVGPHRDEITVLLGGKPARDFASQGQVRSCVLALRLAEAAEMQARTRETPVFLLDDLASELDPNRKERVLDLLHPDWQTMMTTARESDFPSSYMFDQIIRLT